MTTDDEDTPVDPVEDDRFASNPTHIGGTHLGSTDGPEFVENYDLTLDDTDEYSLSEKMVHYCGGQILQVHWAACKAVLAFFAGSRVSKSRTSKKPEMERECLEIYYNAIEELDVEYFNRDARDYFCHSFQKKEEPMPAYSLWRYYYDSRAKIRRDVLQYFPKDLVTMKSGRGFHDSCNDVYVKAYRLEMEKCKVKGGGPKYTAEEIEEMHPPHHWEYTKSPWHFGLLIKIFRRDPQLALHVASVMSDPVNVPVSRAELRRQKQVRMQDNANKENRGPPSSINVTNKARTSSSLSSSTVGGRGGQSGAANVSGGSECSSSAGEERRVNDARILISNTHANQHLLNRRIGKMDEIERSLAALEKMKPFISEAAYAEKMRSAFASLPVFDTYDTDVTDAAVPSTASANSGKRVRDNEDDNDDENHNVRPRYTAKNKSISSVLDDDDSIEINNGNEEENNREKCDDIDRFNNECDDCTSIDNREHFPILDRTGKMIGMNYCLKNGKVAARDGKRHLYLWENFMDRFDSDDEHYPIVDETGKMISLDTVSKSGRRTRDTALAKEHKKKA
jgi:hypothetical protein